MTKVNRLLLEEVPVYGPSSSLNNTLPVFDGTTGKLIKDSGILIADVGTGDVVGPASSTDGRIAVFDGTTGKLIKQSTSLNESQKSQARIDIGAGRIKQGIFQHRLTLSSGVPVMGKTNYVNQSTLYLTPYSGNIISIYTGTNWTELSIGEISLSLSTTTIDTVYDVFLDYNGGTPQLMITAWSNGNTRATNIIRQNGVFVKDGTPTQLFVGTIRTFNAGQCDWLVTNTATGGGFNRLYVWNMYNRVPIVASSIDTTSSWTYSSAAVRVMGGLNSNSIQWVQGLSEDTFIATQQILTSTSGFVSSIGIGLNRRNARDNASSEALLTASGSPTLQIGLSSILQSIGTIGYNFVSPVESSPQNVSITFYATQQYQLFQFSMDM